MIKIPVKDITKIKQFETATIIYTPKTVWVCVPEQKIPTTKDLFITLVLKERD